MLIESKKMTFCTITPDRGDRPQFTEFCKHQLSRMTVKPAHSYFIDHAPDGDGVDLILRVREGIIQAKADGFTKIFIIENDDYYPANYFTKMKLEEPVDFIGSLTTFYYNIFDRRFQRIQHDNRSSLFTTGFTYNAIEYFNWKRLKQTDIRLDIAFWDHARRFQKQFVVPGAVGIKHGLGMCAGAGHYKDLKEADSDFVWLKNHVDSEAMIFYKTLKRQPA